MALIASDIPYSYDKEIALGDVSPGHTVLIKDFTDVNNAVPYLVCKLGTTPLVKTKNDRKTIVLCNIITGRIVLKAAITECNLVSNRTHLSKYTRG